MRQPQRWTLSPMVPLWQYFIASGRSVRGLVNLMDAALAAAPRFHARALFLYGGKDELLPDKATAATWMMSTARSPTT